MREDYKKQLSRQIEKHFLDLEQMILEDIVRRIKSRKNYKHGRLAD